jgi:hypothetical protein
METISAPPIPDKPVPVVNGETLRKVLKACDGKEFTSAATPRSFAC